MLTYAVLWVGLGLALSKQAKYSLAASAYLAAYRLDPSNPALLANVGQALVQAGDKQQACLNTALTLPEQSLNRALIEP